MQTPMNDYYTKQEYQYALRQMYRMLERNRIMAMAQILKSDKASLKVEYTNKMKTAASQTQRAIQVIKGELDLAIQGQARKKIEETVREKNKKYTTII